MFMTSKVELKSKKKSIEIPFEKIGIQDIIDQFINPKLESLGFKSEKSNYVPYNDFISRFKKVLKGSDAPLSFMMFINNFRVEMNHLTDMYNKYPAHKSTSDYNKMKLIRNFHQFFSTQAHLLLTLELSSPKEPLKKEFRLN